MKTELKNIYSKKDLAIQKIIQEELIDITEDRYMSTYGFVSINGLEELANWVLGNGTEDSWEASDDCEQIQQLCDAVKKGKYIVSVLEANIENDIDVRIDDGYYTIRDISRAIDDFEYGSLSPYEMVEKIKQIIS
ncbi:MAG: hypothetical protein HOB69_11225 [Flavobacterium sp.]|jgi:hypothetical protein|nr:hypothetical protein [Flavobacterium sp.]